MLNISATDVFAALANDTRLRCLLLVAGNDDVCVCEVVAALRISQPGASKSLNALKAAGLLRDRRDANWIYYSLAEDLPPWLAELVDGLLEELAGRRPYVTDAGRLARLALRPEKAICA